MKIYNYHYETKEFLSSKEAVKSPLEKDVYLLPANSTAIEPFKNKKDFAICFDEEKNRWHYVVDNRGKTCFNTQTKEKQEIDYLGELKEGFTFLKPNDFEIWNNTKWIDDIELLQSIKKDEINAQCKKSIVSGFSSNVLKSLHFYKTTLEDQENLLGAISTDKSISFKCSVDKKVWEYKLHTNAQLKQLLFEFTNLKIEYLKKVNNLKIKNLKAKTKKEIEVIK